MSDGRVTIYIATSVDGYIADEDGSVDWLDAVESDGELDAAYSAFVDTVDCLAMGARTYEQVLGFGEWPDGDTPTYVFTHRDLEAATEAVEFVEGVSAHVDDLEHTDEHIWLVGGAALAQSFLRAARIDVLRLAIVPILLGDGVGLFAGEYEPRDLSLLETNVFDNGIVEHAYDVLGPRPNQI